MDDDERHIAATEPGATADRPPGVGTVVGRFTLESVIGAGGMGIVFAAHDPVLDRRIAIKLIRGNHGSAALRLHREAQALARLAHPNVVTVHEAGVAGDGVFVAMELVDGSNLREWLAQPRPWREIVATFVAAGRGLAAAHAAGLVHRDFKPANVFVDRTGAVKVGDFGLVGVVAGETGPTNHPSPLEVSVTRTGALMGTPAYMAPEQVRGGVVDERADQFAFCQSLAEALGDDPPAWLAKATARGLAMEPAARWPSMNALLDVLERTPRRRRRLAIGAAMIAAVAVTAALVWIAAPRRAVDPCAGADDRLAAAWGPAQRTRLRAHLIAVDPTGGEARFTAAAALLDRYTGDWQGMRTETCRANRVKGGQSDALFERRMRCLDRRLVELADSAAALDRAHDAVTVDRAIKSAHQLGGLAACADAEALMAALPPPDDPAARGEVEAVEREVDAVERDRQIGGLDGLDARALAAVERARRAGHPPALAHALRVRAQLEFDQLKVTVGIEILRELTEVAAQAHDDAMAVWAWSELLSRISWDLGKPDDAKTLLPAARAEMLRAGDDPELRAVFLYGESQVLYGVQDEAGAHARLAEARKILEQLGAGPSSSPLTPRLADNYYQDATFYAMSGAVDQAEAMDRRAIELFVAAYGPDHPETAWGWELLGDSLRFGGRNQEALVAYEESIRIREARIGDKPVLAKSLTSMSSALLNLDRPADAVPRLERAVGILRLDHAWDDELASALMVQANTFVRLHRVDDGERAYGEAIALFEQLGGDETDLPNALYNRGEMLAGSGRCERALADYARSTELTAAYRGAENPQMIFPLSSTGKCLVELGRAGEALAPLERALAMTPRGDQVALVIQAHYYHGRARIDSGRDRTGGLREVRQARDDAAALGSETGRRMAAEADRYLGSK